MAEETKFVQRHGVKLNGEIFFDLIVFHSDNLKKQSLNDLTIILKKNYNIEHYEKQSLQDRFNQYAVKFLSSALEKLLQTQINTTVIKELANHVNRVPIKDSVCFQVDESLADDYPGSGGAGSAAAMRIQFEYDLLSGNVIDLSINAFTDTDAKNSVATIECTQEGDLLLRDLAYMSIEVLNKIIEKLAYFLCRANANVKMYELINGEYVELNFSKIVKYMEKHKIAFFEKEIYYGKNAKLKTRLILHLLSSEELAKRLRKAKKTAKKEKRNLSKTYKARAALNLFITNASVEQIPTENVWQLYRLRWQIELIFKIWKSICNIEKIKKVKKERLECYVYSKLIILMLGWKMIWSVAKNMLLMSGKVLSFYKAFKTLINNQLDNFHLALKSSQNDIANIVSFIVDFYDISVTKHLLEKRLKEQTSHEILKKCLLDKTIN